MFYFSSSSSEIKANEPEKTQRRFCVTRKKMRKYVSVPLKRLAIHRMPIFYQKKYMAVLS